MPIIQGIIKKNNKTERNKEIADMFWKEIPLKEIAEKFKISVQRVSYLGKKGY